MKINLIWSRTKFLSHRTARFYFLTLAQHTIPQHMTSTRSAILLYNRVGACIGRWDELPGCEWSTNDVLNNDKSLFMFAEWLYVWYIYSRHAVCLNHSV